MKIIGVTGGVAAGKTTLCKMFQQVSIPVWNADKAAHSLMKRPEIFDAIARIFPSAIIKQQINRVVLGDMVFADDEKREQLEQIIHPALHHHCHEWLKSKRRQRFALVVLDVPLLFEAGFADFCDKTIFAYAPLDVRRRRALMRPGMSEHKFYQIVASQLSSDIIEALCDETIATHRARALARRQIQQLIKEMRHA